jgi:putative DNA-invertase from lambdoid prophage Rac
MQVNQPRCMKVTRDAVLAFIAAQGEADYRNRAEMQRRGVAIAKADGRYKWRARSQDYSMIWAWRPERGVSIRATAEQFGIGTATVKRVYAERAS